MNLRRAAAVVTAVAACSAGCRNCEKNDPAAAADAAAAGEATARPAASAKPPRYPPELQAACYGVGKARCVKLNTCGGPALAVREGTVLSCLDRGKNRCLAERAPLEGGLKIAQLDACAKALQAATCPDVLADRIPECSVHLPGTITNGSACVADAQCASELCVRPPDAICGTCEEAPKEGEACKQGRCGPDLVCVAERCVQRAAKGQPCAGPAGCEPGLGCAAGKCAALGQLKDRCDPASAPCDASSGLRCDPGTKSCVAVTIAKIGEPCAEEPNPGAAICSGEAGCQDGKCQRRPTVGERCTASGLACSAPTRCVDGTCQIPDVAACAK